MRQNELCSRYCKLWVLSIACICSMVHGSRAGTPVEIWEDCFQTSLYSTVHFVHSIHNMVYNGQLDFFSRCACQKNPKNAHKCPLSQRGHEANFKFLSWCSVKNLIHSALNCEIDIDLNISHHSSKDRCRFCWYAAAQGTVSKLVPSEEALL